VVWIASAATAAVVIAAAAIFMSVAPYEDRSYLRSLQTEIGKVEKQAQHAAQLDRDADAARRKALLLDEFRRRPKADMDVLAELTRILPPPAWLNSVDISRTQVVLAGEAEQAAPLLKTIDSSPLFEASEFLMPPMRQGTVEVFRIRTTREAGR
jgi:Tfp pilus assembly protein PilN